MRKLNILDLRDAIVSGGNLRDELREDGKVLSAAIVDVLCQVAQVHADALDANQFEGTAAVAPVKAPAKETHRHMWGGLNGGVCVAEPGCMAKPRKKKEAPTAEGGSQP